MTLGWLTVPERDAYWLRNATVPATLLTDVPAENGRRNHHR